MTETPSHRATMRQSACDARAAANLAIKDAQRVVAETTAVIDSLDKHDGTVIPLNAIAWYMTPAHSASVEAADSRFMEALKALKEEATAARRNAKP